MEKLPADVSVLASNARRVAVLTGAGMSVESGLDTFRGSQRSLWERFDPMTLATPEAFAAEPDLVWGWYRWRSAQVRDTEPNAGHHALAEWSERDGVDLWIITQNVDDLHERAGSGVLSHLHGSLFALRCAECGHLAADEQPLPSEQIERIAPPECVKCGGSVRPGVVWFGEELPKDALAVAEAIIQSVDLVLVVGTSGTVFPAAGLPYLALRQGIPVVEIGPENTEFSQDATVTWRSTAGTALPALVGALKSA